MYRGFGIIGHLCWLDTKVTPEEKQRVLAGLPDDLRRAMPTLDSGAWYPIEWLTALYDQGIALRGARTTAEREAVIHEMGVAARAFNRQAALSMLVRFLKPATLLKKLPQFWPKYYQGAAAPTIQVDRDGHRALLDLRGFTASPHIGANVKTFIRLIFEAVGGDAEVQYTRDGDDHHWDVRWT
jgi:hypothetical protein